MTKKALRKKQRRKRKKGGVTSANQKQWIKTLNEAGIQTVVCKGCDAAIEFIESITKA
jgi:hypothetical protein